MGSTLKFLSFCGPKMSSFHQKTFIRYLYDFYFLLLLFMIWCPEYFETEYIKMNILFDYLC